MSELLIPKQEFLDSDVLSEAVEERMVEQSRWEITYEAIILWPPNLDNKPDLKQKHYVLYYSRGATEQQDSSSFDYTDEIELYEVERTLRVVTSWQHVAEAIDIKDVLLQLAGAKEIIGKVLEQAKQFYADSPIKEAFVNQKELLERLKEVF